MGCGCKTWRRAAAPGRNDVRLFRLGLSLARVDGSGVGIVGTLAGLRLKLFNVENDPWLTMKADGIKARMFLAASLLSKRMGVMLEACCGLTANILPTYATPQSRLPAGPRPLPHQTSLVPVHGQNQVILCSLGPRQCKCITPCLP
jgi:hypothetical protein